jgi:hypothetical protein
MLLLKYDTSIFRHQKLEMLKEEKLSEVSKLESTLSFMSEDVF